MPLKNALATLFIAWLGLFFVQTPTIYAQFFKKRFKYITTNEGLSSNHVYCIYKDRDGFMWFGTVNGLNRYDGHSIRVYRNRQNDSASIGGNYILSMTEDKANNFWIGSKGNGLSRLNRNTGRFVNYKFNKSNPNSLSNNTIKKIFTDRNGNVWVLCSNGLNKYKPNTDNFQRYIPQNTDLNNIGDDNFFTIFETRKGAILLGTYNGIKEFVPDKGTFINYTPSDEFPPAQVKMGKNIVYSILEDANGNIYAGTWCGIKRVSREKKIEFLYTGDSRYDNSSNIFDMVFDTDGQLWFSSGYGVHVLNPTTKEIQNYTEDPSDKYGFASAGTNGLYLDNAGNLWIGTSTGGVNICSPYDFGIIQYSPDPTKGLSSKNVSSLLVDKQDNIWIGTEGGGLNLYNRKANRFEQYKSGPGSISSNFVFSIYETKAGEIWIGCYGKGVCRYIPHTKKFINYANQPDNPNSLIHNQVNCIFEDPHGQVWLGTWWGLERWDKATDAFIHYNQKNSLQLSSSIVLSLAADQNNNLWIGTYNGLNRMDIKTGKTEKISYQEKNETSPEKNSIWCLLTDHKGYLWIGTEEQGLSVLDPKTLRYKVFKEKDGLASNNIQSLTEDMNGNVWIGTVNGLTRWERKTGTLSSFFYEDGIQDNYFAYKSADIDSRGNIFMGGRGGVSVFHPSLVKENKNTLQTHLTSLYILGKEVAPGTKVNGRIVLDKPLNATPYITLTHRDKTFSIDFLAFDYPNPRRKTYRYMLEGFDNSWQETSFDTRSANYTNLPAGNYTFKVKAVLNKFTEGPVSELIIKVKPPFWETYLALLFYLVAIAGLLFWYRAISLRRYRLKNLALLQQEKAQQQHQLDQMKLKFFSYISHEFRTPLTLITAPAERLLKNPDDKSRMQLLDTIIQNSKKLLNLISQLLDLQKIAMGKASLNIQAANLSSFTATTANSFKHLAHKKGIRFDVKYPPENSMITQDIDKMEAITGNLLSNAFKFTPKGGRVWLSVEVLPAPDNKPPESRTFEIKVSDNGMGIPSQKLKGLFTPYYQVEAGDPKNSTGLGLAYSHELVLLMKGSIDVESEEGKGTTFTVKLPVCLDKASGDIYSAPELTGNIVPHIHQEKHTSLQKGERPLLLLVEDNEEMLNFLQLELVDFRLLKAPNLAEANRMLNEHLPDVIVCDIMLPDGNGLDFCRQLKQQGTLSHIPVLMLTALTHEQYIIKSYEYGADEYMVKPFNVEILKARIYNLIESRSALKKNFIKEFAIPVKAGLVATNDDEALLKKIMQITELHIAEADFDIDSFTQELGMSKTQLYRKFETLMELSPKEFVRDYRIRYSATLLKARMPIAEAAFRSGFPDPSYYSKVFRKHFGVTPREYILKQTPLEEPAHGNAV